MHFLGSDYEHRTESAHSMWNFIITTHWSYNYSFPFIIIEHKDLNLFQMMMASTVFFNFPSGAANSSSHLSPRPLLPDGYLALKKGWGTIKQWGDCLFMFTLRQQLRWYHSEERRANEHHPPTHLVPRKVGLPTPPSSNDRKSVMEQLLFNIITCRSDNYILLLSFALYILKWQDISAD